jgi:GNAT superfamily N-acetyltransferase
MADMLVKLYDLPCEAPPLPSGITVRRALGPEKTPVVEWVASAFSRGWADECELAIARRPIACFIAHEGHALAGFCSYDATARGLLGPIGVAERYRGKGLGRCLVLAALKDMAAQGYAYAVVGWAGPQDFFARTAGAIPIPDSKPGLYRGLLPSSSEPLS